MMLDPDQLSDPLGLSPRCALIWKAAYRGINWLQPIIDQMKWIHNSFQTPQKLIAQIFKVVYYVESDRLAIITSKSIKT